MLDQKDLVLLEKGEPVNHFLLLKKCEIRLTKSNKQYLFLELGDKTASVNANVWDNFEDIYKQVITGDVVKIIGSMDDFQGSPQIRINSIRKSNSKDDVLPQDFLPLSKRDPEVMKKEFLDRIEQISNSYLQTLMKQIFIGEKLDKFLTAPAGKSWHHSYIHGLIEHTLEIIKICNLMCDIHPEINRDILICGAMLHDLGKVEELSFETSFDYTDKGKLLGHIVISAMFINEETEKISNFPEEIKNCLLHLILSHQGKLEYASPVVPKTLEAITLYQADELSAKVNAYKNALSSNTNSENKWTKYISLASTDLYNHGIPQEENDGINKTLFD
jgi:3'-5' exoribonuclease